MANCSIVAICFRDCAYAGSDPGSLPQRLSCVEVRVSKGPPGFLGCDDRFHLSAFFSQPRSACCSPVLSCVAFHGVSLQQWLLRMLPRLGQCFQIRPNRMVLTTAQLATPPWIPDNVRAPHQKPYNAIKLTITQLCELVLGFRTVARCRCPARLRRRY
jgi:hypothetical protein